MTKYTFTFGIDEEKKFRKIMDRLDPADYILIEDIKLVKPTEPRYSDRTAVLEMDPDTALTFRMGMKQLKIERERTEEELKEKAAADNRHKVKVVVQVDPSALPPKV